MAAEREQERLWDTLSHRAENKSLGGTSKCLRVSLVGMREGNGQSITGLFLLDGIIVHELPKIHLAPATRMGQRQKALI